MLERVGESADAAMTKDRVEQKYLVPGERVSRLLGELNHHLPPHRFIGEGANRLPGAQHFVTTIYFDTDARTHYRQSIENHAYNVKIRAKEYYDVHPSLAELATSASQIARYQPWVWFELKRREGSRTMKQRFRLLKCDVPGFFTDGHFAPSQGGREAEQAAREDAEASAVLGYCKGLSQPLGASTVVNYRRLSFQDPSGSLRVTLDLGLAFFAPPEALWTKTRALERSCLGQKRGGIDMGVLEVKRRGPVPAWLEGVLGRAAVVEAAGFSKFVASSEAVYGEVSKL